jgi:aminopeptidase YwaD
MNNYALRLLTFFVLVQSISYGQRLRKADRTIVSNIHNHLTFLNSESLNGRIAGTEGEKLAGEYIIKLFNKAGLKPRGDGNSWMQSFEIYDGKEVLPATQVSINDHPLILFQEYFPLVFSANKNTSATVAVALAENGVPWFKDLKEILDEVSDSAHVDTLDVIRNRAKRAAKKGATAFIVYNTASKYDLSFDKLNKLEQVEIPVIYLKRNARKKYLSDESAALDIAINVALEPKKRMGKNVIGYSDNGADSTIIIDAHLDKETDVAALLEIARIMKGSKKSNNFLYIAYCGEKNGSDGKQYFIQHPPVDMKSVKYTLDLDTVTLADENPKGLFLVKQSVELAKK